VYRHSKVTAFFGEAVQFPRRRQDFFRLAQVLVGVAEDAVDLGQGYPYGSPLALSCIRTSLTLWYRYRTTGRTG
jgi:hypothetical protein